MWYLSFTVWLISLSVMLSSSIHAVAKGKSSFLVLVFCDCEGMCVFFRKEDYVYIECYWESLGQEQVSDKNRYYT